MNLISALKESLARTLSTKREHGGIILSSGEASAILAGSDLTIQLPGGGEGSFHTHPHDFTFSIMDVKADLSYGLKFGIVVKPTGFVDIIDYARTAEKEFSAFIYRFTRICNQLGFSPEETNRNDLLRRKMMFEYERQTGLYHLQCDAINILS